MIFALAFVAGLIPFHGTVLAAPSPQTAIVRNDAIPETLPSTTRNYRIEPQATFVPGTGIDGFLDKSTTPWTLRDAVAAAPFSPGAPQPDRVIPVDIGKPLPSAKLVDQNGTRCRSCEGVRRQDGARDVHLYALPRPHVVSRDQRQIRLHAVAFGPGAVRIGRDHARPAVRFAGRPA